MTKVKICGITNVQDALFAVNCGADAIGVINVRGTPRFVDLKTASQIFESLPVFVSKVVVATPKKIEEALEIEKTGADYIQLHGDESPDFILELREKTRSWAPGIIKKIAVGGDYTKGDSMENDCIENSKTYSEIVDAILLDTKSKDRIGGSGRVHDWNLSRKIVESIDTPVILAGGLVPGNVTEAVEQVMPYAVDTSSGVESVPGKKDKNRIEQFIMRAKYVV